MISFAEIRTKDEEVTKPENVSFLCSFPRMVFGYF